MCSGAKAVEYLHDGDERQDLGDQRNDLVVVGEENRQVVSKRAIQNEVEDAEEACGNKGLLQGQQVHRESIY